MIEHELMHLFVGVEPATLLTAFSIDIGKRPRGDRCPANSVVVVWSRRGVESPREPGAEQRAGGRQADGTGEHAWAELATGK